MRSHINEAHCLVVRGEIARAIAVLPEVMLANGRTFEEFISAS